MIRSKIRDCGLMERERCAQQRRTTVGGRGEVPQPDRGQLQGDPVGRGPLRFTGWGLRSDRQVGESTRRGRGELARGFSDESRPQERHGGKLRAVQAVHRSNLNAVSDISIASDQPCRPLSASDVIRTPWPRAGPRAMDRTTCRTSHRSRQGDPSRPSPQVHSRQLPRLRVALVHR